LDLERFVKKVLGNNYKLNLKDILFPPRTTEVIDLERRAFFCSELIAKIYKEVGLLETGLSSPNFLPGDFS
jgi:hypothetical protein